MMQILYLILVIEYLLGPKFIHSIIFIIQSFDLILLLFFLLIKHCPVSLNKV